MTCKVQQKTKQNQTAHADTASVSPAADVCLSLSLKRVMFRWNGAIRAPYTAGLAAAPNPRQTLWWLEPVGTAATAGGCKIATKHQVKRSLSLNSVNTKKSNGVAGIKLIPFMAPRQLKAALLHIFENDASHNTYILVHTLHPPPEVATIYFLTYCLSILL